ncbi:hypothetical protein Q5752_002528 [Cryptotrichosporon argae]
MSDEVSAATSRADTPAGAQQEVALEFAKEDRQEQGDQKGRKFPNGMNPKLRYIKPYWWPYRTFVKERWIGRQLLEVISTEFRDRSVDYYRHALESGVTRVNGATAYPELILRNGDRLDNTVHRHEPPISTDKVLILHIDRAKEFIVISKPGSVPIHATGRYFRHTLLELLKSDYGINAYSVNRLDRLTSGLMILALSGKASSRLAAEFMYGTVQKEYVARVKGRFPDGEITVDQPLMTVDRQMGLVIVTPQGKEATTIFKRMSYDQARDQSVVHSHQIRVHLQYLGYPIANDPLYGHERVWGASLGRGGVELAEQTAESSFAAAVASRVAAAAEGTPLAADLRDPANPRPNLDDREYDNIDLTSPIRLSQQAKDIIAKLRRMKDEAEDWVKWKEVTFAIKSAQDKLEAEEGSPGDQATNGGNAEDAARAGAKSAKAAEHPRLPPSRTKAALPGPVDGPSALRAPEHLPDGFCTECFVPVADDPDPETLFIYLHALRYTTEQLGRWETPLPRWAGDGWDGDWRGWIDGAVLPEVDLETGRDDVVREDKPKQRSVKVKREVKCATKQGAYVPPTAAAAVEAQRVTRDDGEARRDDAETTRGADTVEA